MYRNYINIVSGELKQRLSWRKSISGREGCKNIRKQSQFVIVNNMPLRVDSWGGYLPSKIMDGSQQKPKELILMIPGNPGVTKFYEEFLQLIHERTQKPVWIVSHGGHDPDDRRVPSIICNAHLHTLGGHTEQKKKFIDTYLEGVTLHCIGHSIGCKILLDIMSEENKPRENIKRGYFLFPVMERMAKTNNGVTLNCVLHYWVWLLILVSGVFRMLPKKCQMLILRFHYYLAEISRNTYEAVRISINPFIVNRVFYMAKDELKVVRELDYENIRKNKHRLKLYYGSDDGWAPPSFFAKMKNMVPGVDGEICTEGISHTFTFRDSVTMGLKVSNWIRGYEKERM